MRFLDASLVFNDIDELVYHDFGHLRPRGYEILGEHIGQELIAAGQGD